MFPELANALWELPETEGTTFVIYRHRGCNLRTRFSRIIKRAGVKPSPKPFHNLRSTRETELANEYPIHVVCKWIGNSPTIAMKHYLQMTDDHFKKAIGKAAQKTAQSVSDKGANGLPTAPRKSQKPNKKASSLENSQDASSGRGTRTPDTRIMIPLL